MNSKIMFIKNSLFKWFEKGPLEPNNQNKKQQQQTLKRTRSQYG